jgi:hypothetical protein
MNCLIIKAVFDRFQPFSTVLGRIKAVFDRIKPFSAVLSPF